MQPRRARAAPHAEPERAVQRDSAAEAQQRPVAREHEGVRVGEVERTVAEPALVASHNGAGARRVAAGALGRRRGGGMGRTGGAAKGHGVANRAGGKPRCNPPAGATQSIFPGGG